MIAPDPVLVTIFGIDIMWYGALIGTGFLLAIMISYCRAPKFGIDRDFILTLTIWIIPSALVGARLYYVIFSWENYAGDLTKIFDVRGGGLAIHGGLILSFVVGYFICRKYKERSGHGKMGKLLQRGSPRRPYRSALGANHRRRRLSPNLSL